MNLRLAQNANGRVHAVLPDRGRGRPLDLQKPLDQIRWAVNRNVDRLARRIKRLEREQKRWAEVASSFDD